MTPAVAIVEMMQCLVQAVGTDEKKRQPLLGERSRHAPRMPLH